MDLLPAPMLLQPEHLAQLELTGEELELFLTYQPRLSKLFLNRSGKAPTALHSWGSQVTACVGALDFTMKRSCHVVCMESFSQW